MVNDDFEDRITMAEQVVGHCDMDDASTDYDDIEDDTGDDHDDDTDKDNDDEAI